MREIGPEFEQQLADAEPYAQRVQVALTHGNYEEALFAIEEHKRFMAEKKQPLGDPLKLTLADAGMSMRTIGYLETKCIDTIADLLDLTWEELQVIPGIGPAVEKEILEVLERLGFELKGRSTDDSTD